MNPFGFPVVLYLFLASLAAGAALFGSMALDSRSATRFQGGKRALFLALGCSVVGAVCLVLDLTRPAEFLLILTSANPASVISWGARTLVLFIFSSLYVWTTVSGWNSSTIKNGFRGTDLAGLWIMRIAALGLAIYPAFVLRQGGAFPLWQNWAVIPLITVSAFHVGVTATAWMTPPAPTDQGIRKVEIGLAATQTLLVAALLTGGSSSPLAWVLILIVGSFLPLALAALRFQSTLPLRVGLVLSGTFALRYWLIAAGQSV